MTLRLTVPANERVYFSPRRFDVHAIRMGITDYTEAETDDVTYIDTTLQAIYGTRTYPGAVPVFYRVSDTPGQFNTAAFAAWHNALLNAQGQGATPLWDITFICRTVDEMLTARDIDLFDFVQFTTDVGAHVAEVRNLTLTFDELTPNILEVQMSVQPQL